jgi:hypothetical protein
VIDSLWAPNDNGPGTLRCPARVVHDRNPVSNKLRAASRPQTLTRDGDVSGRQVISTGKKDLPPMKRMGPY